MTGPVLILGGTSEARRLAEALVAGGREVIVSLAGATRMPAPQAGRLRLGGFGGAEGLARYIREQQVAALIDATHPFAARISHNAAAAARSLGLPHVQLLRPEWVAGPGDAWHMIDDEAETAALIPPGSVVFVATGRQTLHRYAPLAAHSRIICRQIDPPDGPFPFANGEFLIGRPPFSVADEKALFSRLGVDWLVVKNAGGAASRTKLDAARALKIPVAMIRRPRQPDCARVARVEQAIAWVAEVLG